MSRSSSIEQIFLNDVHTFIKNNELQRTQHLSYHILDREEYCLNVGYLQAMRDMRTEVQRLLKAYFPNE